MIDRLANGQRSLSNRIPFLHIGNVALKVEELCLYTPLLTTLRIQISELSYYRYNISTFVTALRHGRYPFSH